MLQMYVNDKQSASMWLMNMPTSPSKPLFVYPTNSLLIENDVCYLVLCDKMFSKRSAFTYLEDLAQEFHKNYGRKVNTVTRPYAFIEFDVYIQKTKKSLTDRRRNINSINNQLQDVQRIMVSVAELFRQILGYFRRLKNPR